MKCERGEYFDEIIPKPIESQMLEGRISTKYLLFKTTEYTCEMGAFRRNTYNRLKTGKAEFAKTQLYLHAKYAAAGFLSPPTQPHALPLYTSDADVKSFPYPPPIPGTP